MLGEVLACYPGRGTHCRKESVLIKLALSYHGVIIPYNLLPAFGKVCGGGGLWCYEWG